ncbi:glycosyltransferase family 4 protein [bacterium]|nr:glycosyltransferase family 4 protein [bacterium]
MKPDSILPDKTKPARILIVCRYHFSRFAGGSEFQSWMLSKELSDRGWDVHYASEMNHVPVPPVLEGVTLHGLPEDPRYPEGNRKPLRELMQELQPDVVVAKVYNLYVRDAMLEAPEDAVKIWWLAAELDGRLGKFLWQSLKTQGILRFVKVLPKNLMLRWGAAQGRRKADIVLQQYAGQTKGIRSGRSQLAVMHNSHPPVPSSEIQIHDGRPQILWVATLKRGKRPELFWKLAERCSDLDVKFIMAGRTQRPYQDAQIKQLESTIANFTWVGQLSREEAARQYSAAHLFVCTSMSEGFSNTFIEAWMHGVPVLSTGVDPGGYLREQGLGFCVDSLDQLEAAVRDLIKNQEKRKAIGEKARMVANNDFNLGKNADIFESIVTERGVRMPERSGDERKG